MEAIIFDMDGVIIDSEGFWKQAEFEVFSKIGVELSAELCAVTCSMTTAEVTQFWYERFPWHGKTHNDVENAVVNRVAELINEKGKLIEGVKYLIHRLSSAGYKIGLATNSPACLISVILQKFELENYFDATTSAEFEEKGKPHPSVYNTISRKLNVHPKNCVAIEDTESGLVAAKAAGMKTILLSTEHSNTVADFVVKNHSTIFYQLL